MEFTSFVKLLSESDGIGSGFFVFGCFSQIFNLVFLCLLLVLGHKFLHLKGPSSFAQYLEKIYRKTDCNKNGFVSKSDLDQKKAIILHWSSDSSANRLSYDLPDGLDLKKKRDSALSETEVDEVMTRSDDEDQVFDVITLRKMVKRERKRGDRMKVEVEKERLAAESAAEEAMAMLLKLRMEKSSVEMEAKQYRRVAEQKQIYDQQVIQSLQWVLIKTDDQEDKIEEIDGD